MRKTGCFTHPQLMFMATVKKVQKKWIVCLKGGNHYSVDQLKMDYTRYSNFLNWLSISLGKFEALVHPSSVKFCLLTVELNKFLNNGYTFVTNSKGIISVGSFISWQTMHGYQFFSSEFTMSVKSNSILRWPWNLF